MATDRIQRNRNREFSDRKMNIVSQVLGRGSWIRTNDLQYPKLPRYQAALYPDHALGNTVDTRLNPRQQGTGLRLTCR